MLLTLFLFSLSQGRLPQTSLPVWALGRFVRPVGNPVISPRATSTFPDPMIGQQVAWEAGDTFNPAAIVRNGKVVVLYRAEDNTGQGIGGHTSRLGYAESSDGTHFHRNRAPVLFPGKDGEAVNETPGGCEDPRVVKTEGGTYVVFYTQWNRKRARLAVATSRDLKHWTKHGPAFKKDADDLYFTKSAAPVTKLVGSQLVMAKLEGKYWIYWGEQGVYAATSTDLVTWTPVRDREGHLRALISPRPGFFDSDLTECGPPALMTQRGIVLIYNGKNSATKGDKRYPSGAYCAGQVLFSTRNPLRAIARLDQPFFKPTAPFEKSGQYRDGTVFAEGLVWFRSKWLLYYGCADSKVAVAVFDPLHP